MTSHTSGDFPSGTMGVPTLLLPESSFSATSQACLEMAVAAAQARDSQYLYKPGTPHKPSPAMEGNKDFQKLKAQVRTIRDQFSSMQKTLAKVTNPETYLELGFHEITTDFVNLLENIRVQEKRTPGDIEREKNREAIPDLPKPDIFMVDSEASLVAMLESIGASLEAEPNGALSIDIGGRDLSRRGTISIIQLFAPAVYRVYLIDIATLQEVAFTVSVTVNRETFTLKYVLESPIVLKLIWDCRADSDALNALFDVKLAGVIDVQLMDVATRTTPRERKRLSPLVQALPHRMRDDLLDADVERWHAIKDLGKLSMAKDAGFEIAQKIYEDCEGSVSKMRAAIGTVFKQRREVAQDIKKDDTISDDPFAQRPLPKMLQEYASNDVLYLPTMHHHYVEHQRWSVEWAERVEQETENRLVLSRSEGFEVGAEEHRNQAPVAWAGLS